MLVNFRYFITSPFLLLLFFGFFSCNPDKEVSLYVSGEDNVRLSYGVESLKQELISQNYKITCVDNILEADLVLGLLQDEEIRKFAEYLDFNLPDTLLPEGFIIKGNGKSVLLAGNDGNGVIYACMELREQLRHKGYFEILQEKVEHPDMLMRGTCIGLQKTEYLPGRRVYEYPYTPELFPWFYDKDFWIDYLDMLARQRFNSLYLWNGHPFASLVKLDDYPYALEVDEETFIKNQEIFEFITKEANKRGIWIIQMFYNIIVSQSFAEYHNIETQNRSRAISPLISDYTRKSIAAFIEKYPNVGLMVTLGEALTGIENEIAWFTETILPGVKDGLAALGIDEEPPVVLRGHDTDAGRVISEARKIYENLYTIHKYNGESLTTYAPQDLWADIHQDLSSIGSVHISNVHILANLEPFRYASPDFIQKSVFAMQDIQGANGLHLYPQAAYWDWPYSSDKVEPRLLQIDRDIMWYKAWGRYAWKKNRERKEEQHYWGRTLAREYGLRNKDGKNVLMALEESGEIAPKLLRTFGISDGNRQTLLLGMFMSQLVNPYKYRVYPSFITSSGPDKEILIDWAEKEWMGLAHRGETPPQIIMEVEQHAKHAVKAIEKVRPPKGEYKEEFERLKNDIYCYRDFSLSFVEKVKAAIYVLRYKYSDDLVDLEQAIPHLKKSLSYYENLTKRTSETYLYANSMQTDLRRIPITGKDGANKHWEDLLPYYTEEYNNFVRNVASLKKKGELYRENSLDVVWRPATGVTIKGNFEKVELKVGERLFSDRVNKLTKICSELEGLSTLRLNAESLITNGSEIEFTTSDSVKLLVGHFNGHSYTILDPPTLETNALANIRGQADIQIANALSIDDMWPVNVYTYDFEPGSHKFKMEKGLVLLLGFVEGNQEIIPRDAGIVEEGEERVVDWLFY